MSDSHFFVRPILNSPYAHPTQHCEIDDETDQPRQLALESRRHADCLPKAHEGE